MSIDDLKDKFIGKNIYIIGSGPSLNRLKKEHFKDGVIIALNKSIGVIKNIEPDIPVFSQQKDGNLNGKRKCTHPNCNNCPFTVDPTPYTLLVHEHESKMCFEKHEERYVFDNKNLGLAITDFSALTAVKIGQLMGGTHFIFIGFDSINGNFDNFNNKNLYSKNYRTQINKQKTFLSKISHEYLNL